ncbi:hypothetical protein SAMN05192576_2213 [Nocardioides szechwanensis]|uniref:Uncharacterized protein n=1 Tax=Nocardioides szechwanensis TaxID=1005944 RepID=A0A1H0BRU5_9ACTN|nr:hypothetical protein SAMN05192576_2213 [Nocardioides szechwanensis]
MARRRKSASLGIERRWILTVQAVGLSLLGLVTLFLVYKGMNRV